MRGSDSTTVEQDDGPSGGGGTVPPTAERSVRVLVVDDEPGMADVTAEFIERADSDIQVTVERSAAAGLERLAAEPFDCIVSDYQMPGTDGIEFLRAVRREEPDLPFILFTGEGSEDLASEAISAGVTDYLQKQGGTDQFELLVKQVLNAVEKHRAEQRVEQYLAASPDGIVVVGPDGRIIQANERMEDLFGYAPSELVGEPIERLVPTDVRERHVGYRDSYLEAPERRPMGAGLKLRGERADGTEFPADVSLSPLYVDGRQEVIAAIRDVTARERRERRIARLNHINRTLRKTTQAAVHADNRVDIAQTVCETLAVSEPYLFAWVGHVEGDRVVPVAAAGVDEGYLGSVTVTADDSATGRGPTGRAVRTRVPQAMQNIPGDPDYEPWGEAAAARGYASSAAIPLVYEGALYGVLNVYAERAGAFGDHELAVLGELGTTVAHAIDRVELTDQLRAQYRTLFEEAPVMAVRTRDESEPVVEDCNERFLEKLGYEREAVLGQPVRSFYTPQSRAIVEREGYQYGRSNAEVTQEERSFQTADGETVETLLRAVPRRDESGAVVGTLAFYVDISERRQLERENERLDAFTSIVSHDLRNPLNVIAGLTDLARAESDSEHLEGIAAATDRMERLVDDLLTLARQGETIGDPIPVTLSKVATRAWQNVEVGSATLEVTVDPDYRVLAAPRRLGQLLENLYRNAVEHGSQTRQDALEHGSTSPDSQARQDALEHDDERVTVRVGTLEDGFYVEDDGPGVPEADREQVFAHGISTSGGTGFGLAIVAAIAEAHGWVPTLTESESGGARFEFRGVERVD